MKLLDTQSSAYVGMLTLGFWEMCYYGWCLVYCLEKVGEELNPLPDISKAEQE